MLGLFVQKHARAVQLHHDVTVIYVTADTGIDKGTKIIDKQNHFGILEIRIYFGKYKNEIANALAYAKYYLKAIQLATSEGTEFDITHVHILTRTAFPALWMKLIKGIPYIITEHWSRYLAVNVDKGTYSGFIRKWFTKLAVLHSSGVTTVTQNLANAMQDLGLKNRYYITPNIADMHDFYPLKVKPNNKVKKLLHVSCFDEPAKNIKGIINAVTHLSKDRDDFILEIVGDGVDYKEVLNYAELTGLVNSRIFFTGLLTGKELSAKMREADALIMFSNYENFPCTIVESLASGVPVISTSVGGISEHLNSSLGTLIKVGNESNLILAINNLIENPDRFDPAILRSYALKHFSMEQSGQLFHDIYVDAEKKM